jgi:hypothetical protein
VKRGDTLLSIAKRFRTTGRSIAYWNRDTYPSLDPESAKYNPDRLEVGWVLRILPGQVHEAPMDAGESPEPTPSPAEGEPPDETPAVSPGPSDDGGQGVMLGDVVHSRPASTGLSDARARVASGS